jgi:hypothetical protein
MLNNTFPDIANFLWSVADMIRDTLRWWGRCQDLARERYLACRDKLESLDDLLQRTSDYAFKTFSIL